MKPTKTLLATVALSVGLLSATGANATLVSALGGQAVYDTDLNITWLANANLAASNTFGVSGINPAGWMTWNTAQSWIAAMDAANYLGYNDWRLPTVTDTGTSGCNFAYSGTDCGYNVNTATGEMAHLSYDELGNKAIHDTTGSWPQLGWGLVNTGPFTNFQTDFYWSGTEDASNTDFVWRFRFDDGNQTVGLKDQGMFALAVRPGQVGAADGSVPEPATLALLGMGLAGLGWARRRSALR